MFHVLEDLLTVDTSFQMLDDFLMLDTICYV
jgi:hypothetical protein